MAIAFDSATSGSTGSGTSHTVSSPDVDSGANYLIVGCQVQNSSNIITGITHDGNAMTKLHENENSPSGFSTSIWGLGSPSSGVNDVVFTLSSSDNIEWSVASYSGVNSSQPDATAVASSASGTSITGTVTTIADNSWVLMFARNNATAYSAGANTVVRATAGASALCDGNSAVTPAAESSVIMTSGSSTAHGGTVVSLSPAVAGGGGGVSGLATRKNSISTNIGI